MARVTEDSLAAQIRTLSPGQSVSRTKRFEMSKAGDGEAARMLARLRNQMNQATGRVRVEQPGNNFRVESAIGVTDDKKAILATVAVTSFGDDADMDDADDIDI